MIIDIVVAGRDEEGVVERTAAYIEYAICTREILLRIDQIAQMERQFRSLGFFVFVDEIRQVRMAGTRDMAIGAHIDIIVVLLHIQMDLAYGIVVGHRLGKTRCDRLALRGEHTCQIQGEVFTTRGHQGYTADDTKDSGYIAKRYTCFHSRLKFIGETCASCRAIERGVEVEHTGRFALRTQQYAPMVVDIIISA